MAMTKAREWPNHARWARDEAAMLAFQGSQKGRRLLDNYHATSELSKAIIIGQLVDCLHRIDQLMTQVGAERQGVGM